MIEERKRKHLSLKEILSPLAIDIGLLSQQNGFIDGNVL